MSETTKIDDGGPAMPTVIHEYGDDVSYSGMTLRDYFAAKAMQSLVNMSCNGDVEVDDDARDDARLAAVNAYAIADAMIAARKK